MRTSSRMHSMRSGSVTKYGERYPRSNCMPSTTSRVVSIVLDSSTVMTPSLPTFFMASAMMLPTCLSVLALMVPTCAIMSPFTSRESLLISPTATSTALSMPRLSAIGLAPAATVRTPSRKIAWASTVAVVVPSPATSDVLLATSLTICAPMFSSASFSSISFATVTPSLVIVGDPYFLSRMTWRPLGPRVTFTALARLLTPRRMPCREESPYTMCFAIPFLLSPARSATWLLLLLRPAAVDDGQHFVLAHDEVLLTMELDLLAGVLPEEDQIAGLDIERDTLAVLVHLALAGGD